MDDARKPLTENELRSLYEKGLTDLAIGGMFGMTGEGIAYRRKKLGLVAGEKNTPFRMAKKFLLGVPVEKLGEDYYSLTSEGFSSKYGLSKTTWLPYIRSVGILSKNLKRINGFPPLTLGQKRLIIAGMLGDGGIMQGRYYEFHSDKQHQYLLFKKKFLEPYSKEVKKVPDGYRFETVCHPVFKEYQDIFYSKGIKGKLIPLDAITELWDDSILAYWFFDDGNFDDEDGTATFANFCPHKEQQDSLVSFLNVRYPWKFSCSGTSIYTVFLPKQYTEEFGRLLTKFATPDLYYKLPEACLSPAMIPRIEIGDVSAIKPKFYRACSDAEMKKNMEDRIFGHYRSVGFPFMKHTEERLGYLVKEFEGCRPKSENGIIAHNTVGQSLCENFFPNIYECSRKGFKPPLELWQEDGFLRKLVRNRLQHADRITDASMRTGIKLTKSCVSNFKPSIAKYLYSEFCRNGKVLDYSCGFGSRMLAAMSLGMDYCGFEPSEKTYNGLLSFGEFLRKRIGGSFEIRKDGSEKAPFRRDYFGFAFSSPPYFDFEHYSDDEGQSLARFPEFENWLKGYWFKTMQNCYDSLVKDGFFGMCLSSATLGNLFEKTFLFAKEIGFHFYKDFSVPFKHVLSGGNKSETILIFSKLPSTSEPKFYGKTGGDKKISVLIKDELMEVSGIKRRLYSKESVKEAVARFRALGGERGVARETYKDGSLGIPPYVLEHKYGSWNNFVRSCGLKTGYEARPPVEYVKDYLDSCLKAGKVLSFYEYGQITGNPSTRLKRQFNAGKPYNHLRNELKSVAVHPELWEDFLAKF